jgi:hypothetical protein
MMANGGYMVVLRRFDSSPSIFLTEVYAMAIIAWRGVRRAADAGETSRNLSTNIQPLNHIHDSICFHLTRHI